MCHSLNNMMPMYMYSIKATCDALLHFIHKFNSNFFNASETEGKGLMNTESHREKITFFSILSESVLLHQEKT